MAALEFAVAKQSTSGRVSMGKHGTLNEKKMSHFVDEKEPKLTLERVYEGAGEHGEDVRLQLMLSAYTRLLRLRSCYAPVALADGQMWMCVSHHGLKVCGSPTRWNHSTLSVF